MVDWIFFPVHNSKNYTNKLKGRKSGDSVIDGGDVTFLQLEAVYLSPIVHSVIDRQMGSFDVNMANVEGLIIFRNVEDLLLSINISKSTLIKIYIS